MLETKRKVLKRLPSLTEKQSFGLYEILTGARFYCRITVESNQALVISINSDELNQIFLGKNLCIYKNCRFGLIEIVS